MAELEGQEDGRQDQGPHPELPSEYFGTNVFIGASTMSKDEIRRRYVNGLDALMWGTDYPHPEGTWPNTVERLADRLPGHPGRGDPPPPRTQRGALLRPRPRRAPASIAERVGPTPEQLNQDPSLRTPPDAEREARFWFDEYDIELEGLMPLRRMTRLTHRRQSRSTAGVAVVTGGAGGIGRGIVGAPRRGCHRGDRRRREERRSTPRSTELVRPRLGVRPRTDVTDAHAARPWPTPCSATHGACHLLFNNAGVTSGGGGKPWQQEPNDWRWCFGVNVFGTANWSVAFVPRMIEAGEPGQVVNTSSGDGGFAPVPTASVYASSKAAVTLLHRGARPPPGRYRTVAGVGVLSLGGLLHTGLFTAQRNRPAELARQGGGTGRPSMTFEQLKEMLAKGGREVTEADLDQLGQFVVDAVKERRYIIAHALDDTAELLHRRADAIARAELPPHHGIEF